MKVKSILISGLILFVILIQTALLYSFADPDPEVLYSEDFNDGDYQ